MLRKTSFKGVLIGIEMGLMIIAIMYPITLKKSAEKSEMVLVIATMISTAIWVAIWSVCNHINIEIEALRHTDMILLSAAVLMFFGSFFVSSSIQKSKEFR
ncbi:ABC-2 transporter permease [Sellimonas caecigallum]|uniref:ABC-2 transporter permease n=1 Tax=Sellimonas caecigallum TaxID=2592333 RepID=UPI002ED0C15C